MISKPPEQPEVDSEAELLIIEIYQPAAEQEENDLSGTLDDEYPEIADQQCPAERFGIECQQCEDGCIHDD